MEIELNNEYHEHDEKVFIIKSIDKCEPPKDMDGENWYRYIVGQGGRKITGYKTGTLKDVTDHVEIFIENLNERNSTGISPSAQAARARKKIA